MFGFVLPACKTPPVLRSNRLTTRRPHDMRSAKKASFEFKVWSGSFFSSPALTWSRSDAPVWGVWNTRLEKRPKARDEKILRRSEELYERNTFIVFPRLSPLSLSRHLKKVVAIDDAEWLVVIAFPISNPMPLCSASLVHFWAMKSSRDQYLNNAADAKLTYFPFCVLAKIFSKAMIPFLILHSLFLFAASFRALVPHSLGNEGRKRFSSPCCVKLSQNFDVFCIWILSPMSNVATCVAVVWIRTW